MTDIKQLERDLKIARAYQRQCEHMFKRAILVHEMDGYGNPLQESVGPGPVSIITRYLSLEQIKHIRTLVLAGAGAEVAKLEREVIDYWRPSTTIEEASK